MPEAAHGRGGPDGRVSTGVPELDTMLHGGLLPRRPYLIVGPAGTGKTTLALKFLIDGARRGEETLLVTLEEPPNEMRFNHRLLQPDLDRIWIFDAIPDVMRYERTPFKDVAQVRDSIRFAQVSNEIRKSPELASVEITLTALEQTLKMQRARRPYTRLAIDSLTALQFFCMKGYDEATGAQSFLRFLTDLDVTTLLTVESAWEELENPERMLARGEIRLFRWEYEGSTVRAIGVEKFRGSAHDIRLHPYRIGAGGIDIRLNETISRDTRIIAKVLPEVIAEEHEAPIVVTVGGEPVPADPVSEILDGISGELAELAQARLDLGAIRGSLDSARQSLLDGQLLPAQNALIEARALVRQMTLGYRSSQPRREAGAPGPARPTRPLPDLPDVLLPPEQLQRMVDHLSAVLPTHLPVERDEPVLAPIEPPAPPPQIEPEPELAPEIVAPESPAPAAAIPLTPTLTSTVLTAQQLPVPPVAAPPPPSTAPAPPSPARATAPLPPLSAHAVPARAPPAPAAAPVHPEHAGGVSFGPTFESLVPQASRPAPAATPAPPAAAPRPAAAPVAATIPPPTPAPVPTPAVTTPAAAPTMAPTAAPLPSATAPPEVAPSPVPAPVVSIPAEVAAPISPAPGPASPTEPPAGAAAPAPKRRRKAAAPGTSPRPRRSSKAAAATAALEPPAPPTEAGATAPPVKTTKPRSRRKKAAPSAPEAGSAPEAAPPAAPTATSGEAPVAPAPSGSVTASVRPTEAGTTEVPPATAPAEGDP